MIKNINIILEKNRKIFGEITKVEKLNVGFTNTIYNINDCFIIKVCTNKNNEENFLKEINFYKANKENELIPKLIFSNINKDDIPYMYEIIEKANGVSLYNVWHKFTESKREEIIKQLCICIKQIHNNSKKESANDWSNHLKKQFVFLNDSAKKLNIFNHEEQIIIKKAYSKFDEYLESKDFVLVHNDLHFDNIIYNNGEIKLIDFERSMYAPRDFELDIIYRMVRMPWEFASEETEKYTKLSYYQNIMLYIKKYYPQIINVPNLYKRLAIYDLIYFFRQLVKNPQIKKLKDNVILAAKIIT